MKSSRKRNAKARGTSVFMAAAQSAGIVSLPGKGAVKREFRAAISLCDSWAHTESMDLDANFERDEPHATRWDYGVGVSNGVVDLMFWIEPHSASSTREVTRMFRKVRWLKEKLGQRTFQRFRAMTNATEQAGHLPYRWLHTGTSHISRVHNVALALAREGIAFPCRHVRLPPSVQAH